MKQPRRLTTIERTDGSRLTLQGLARGAGRLLAAGLLVTLTSTLLFGFATVVIYSLEPDTMIRVNTEPLVMLSVLILIGLLYLTWAAASRRKRMILYLRRFRAERANEALSKAMYRSLRSIGRLVVLDDSTFRPIAIPWRERLILITSALPMLSALLLAVSLGSSISGPVVLEGDGSRLYQHGFINITRGWHGLDDTTTYSGRPALLDFPNAIGLWVILGLSAFAVFRAFFSAWEARRTVETDADISSLIRRTRLLTSRWTAPKAFGSLATVTTVADAKWQQVVQALAEQADAIVLDISQPTDAIWWELRHCLDHHADKLLITMDATSNYLGETGETFSHHDELADHIHGSPLGGVLTYDLSTRTKRRTFYRNLALFVKTRH